MAYGQRGHTKRTSNICTLTLFSVKYILWISCLKMAIKVVILYCQRH